MADAPETKDHCEIWLAPGCGQGDCGDERTWCQDKCAYEDCTECGAKPTRFIRADLVPPQKVLLEVQAALNQSRLALAGMVSRESASRLIDELGGELTRYITKEPTNDKG